MARHLVLGFFFFLVAYLRLRYIFRVTLHI